MNPKLLKSADIADRLNISRSKAYKLIQQGSIPAVRIGKNVRVREEDLILFIESRSSNISDQDY
jgi:excisionase family DNA binding protein